MLELGGILVAADREVNVSNAQKSVVILGLFLVGLLGGLSAQQQFSGGQSVTITGALPAGGNIIGAVTESGTWTVQPGNTANTTAWKVDRYHRHAANVARFLARLGRRERLNSASPIRTPDAGRRSLRAAVRQVSWCWRRRQPRSQALRRAC